MRKIVLFEYGITPENENTVALCELFKKYNKDTIFEFDKADYHFSASNATKEKLTLSNSTIIPLRSLSLIMRNMQNCIIRGNGANFYFSGHTQPITMEFCSNITVENLTINWEKPLVAEGIIKNVKGKQAELFVDNTVFPHRFKNGNLEFDVGNDEWYALLPYSLMTYEPHYRTVKRDSTGKAKIASLEPISDCLYKVDFVNENCVNNGDIVILRHNERWHAGIFTQKCSDITFSNITVYSCGGLGCLSQFCHNMTYQKVNFVPDRSRGRLITSGRDDGMHIQSNTGTVTITECSFMGLMDDPINIHGYYATCNEVIDNKTLRCNFRHFQAKDFEYWAENGQEISFIERDNLSSVAKATVESYNLENPDYFVISFKEELPKEVLMLANKGEALALENLTNTVSLICTKNRFGSCRARGILISTPKPVLVADNYFESSGSAILIPGIADNFDDWFESGECHDVEIRNNVFTDKCLTTSYQFTDGVISISPKMAKPDINKPYHKNIVISDNVFDVAETPLLHAFSCKNLVFENNRIFKSPSADRWHENQSFVTLKYCVDANIKNNDFIGEFNNKLHEENCKNINSDM